MTSAALSPGMAALWLFGGFFVLLVLRVPVAFSLGLACLPILVIEYVSEPDLIAQARGRLARLGFVPFFGRRLLDELPES